MYDISGLLNHSPYLASPYILQYKVRFAYAKPLINQLAILYAYVISFSICF